MKIRKLLNRKNVILLASLIMLFAPLSFASSGHDHKPTFQDIIPFWINFALYVGLLTFLLRGPVSSAWSSRTESIAEAVTKGRREKEAAELELQQAKERQKTVSTLIHDLVLQIQKETEAEVNEILKEAQEKAERVKDQGRDLLLAEERAFEGSLKKALADEVIERATKILSSSLDASVDSRLRQAALNNLSQLVH